MTAKQFRERCCGNCKYMRTINGFEMVCYKKQKYTFHLNLCEEWRR